MAKKNETNQIGDAVEVKDINKVAVQPTKQLRIKLLDPNCAPFKKYADDAGLDLKARLSQLISVGQHSTIQVPTGICVDIPSGYAGFVMPRSGLAKDGIVAEIGTIDSGYIGEIKVNITNNTSEPFHIKPYERIAQLVIQQVEIFNDIKIVDEFKETERGDNGFGSTGK